MHCTCLNRAYCVLEVDSSDRGCNYPKRHSSASVSGNTGKEKASDTRHLTSLLILFSSRDKLVVRQIYLPNNSKNQRFVSKPESQYSCFWPREDASQHRQLAGCDESRAWAAGAECDDKEEIVLLNSGPECHCGVNHHLLQIICSLFSDHEKFLELVCSKDKTHRQMSQPIRNSATRGKPRPAPAQDFQSYTFLLPFLSKDEIRGRFIFR